MWRSSPRSPVGLSPTLYGRWSLWSSGRCWMTGIRVLATSPWIWTTALPNPSAAAFTLLTSGWCSARFPFSQVTNTRTCKQKCRTVKEGKISDFLLFVFQWIPYSWPKWHLLYPLRTPSQHLHRRQVWQLIVSRFKVATSKLRQIEGAVLPVCAQVNFFSFFLIFEDVYLF